MWCLGRQCLVLNADVSSNAALRLCVLSWGQKRAFLWLTLEFTRRTDTTHTSLCDQRALRCTECQTGRSGRHTHMLKNNNSHTYRMSHARQFLCKHVHHSTPTHAVCKSTSINISCLYSTFIMTDNSISELTVTHTRWNIEKSQSHLSLNHISEMELKS